MDRRQSQSPSAEMESASKVQRLLHESANNVYRTTYSDLVKLSDTVISLMNNQDTQVSVYQRYTHWCNLFQDLQEIEPEVRRYLPEAMLAYHDTKYERRFETLIDVRRRMREYLDEDRQNANNSARSRSVTQHTEANLRQRQRQLDHQLQQVASSLSLTEGRLSRVNPADPGAGDVGKSRNPTPSSGLPPTRSRRPAPSAGAGARPVSADADGIAGILSQLTAAITKTQKKNRLPPMEPTKFEGDLLKFPEWLNSFEGLVEAEADTVQEKLHYLGKYTGGMAHEMVRGYLGLMSHDAYDKAKHLLLDKFGNHIKIADAYKQKLNAWPSIRRSDPVALGKFAAFLWQCHAAIDSIGHLEFLNNSDENVKMAKKLPAYIADRWNREVQNARYGKRRGHDDGGQTVGAYPPFVDFCMFVSDEARIAEGPCNFHAGDSGDSKSQDSKKRVTSFSTSTEAQPAKNTSSDKRKGGRDFKPKCLFCKGEHFVSDCPTFIKQHAEEKSEFARNNSLCFGCLRRGHSYRTCRSKNHVLMAEPGQGTLEEVDGASVSAHVNQIVTDGSRLNSMILPVVLRHAKNHDVFVKTYALLDTQSDCCLVKGSVASRLQVPKQNVSLKLITMGSENVVDSEVVFGLQVRGLTESVELNLPKCYTRKSLPANRKNIPDPKKVKSWSHLSQVADELTPYREDMEIGILIGFNCSAALLPQECVYADIHQPYGIRTALGWSVVGMVTKEESQETNEIVSYFTTVKEVSPRSVELMFDKGFQDDADDVAMSMNDRKFLSILDAGVRQEEDGHYSVPLPMKSADVEMPDNRFAAEQCLKSLGKRLQKNAVFKEQYTKFMQEMIAQGHAELAPPLNEVTRKRANFITHHGVKHPKKPDKMRVVFNVSKEQEGKSLNKELLKGPDQINSLTGVLLRFREEPIAVACDIKSMFYQVRIHEEYRDYFRFLWYRDGVVGAPMVEYRMVVNVFGATSSPGCCNYVLKKMAEDQRENFSDETIEFILRNFYVDDGLKALIDQMQALKLIQESNQLCERGGFLLHKYVCNDPDVMAAIPEELRADKLQNVELFPNVENIERSLGVEWWLLHDTFQFRILISDLPISRRNMLSCVSSIYDPLGLIAPIVLRGRRLFQQVCRDGCSWDDPVPVQIEQEWRDWREELQQLPSIQIPRCYKERVSKQIKKIEFHHFCDASEVGYGACSYVRVLDTEDRVDTALLMAKARVTPSKPITIPRLELQSAVLSTQLAKFLKRETSYENVSHFHWTDSMITLGYINNDAKKFQVFVANRIQKIQNATNKDQWEHVRTKANPADIASRGASVFELKNSSLWWQGPALIQAKLMPRDPHPCEPLDERDPEVRRPMISHKIELQEISPLMRVAEQCSTWTRLLRIVSVWVKYCRILRYRVQAKKENEEIETPAAINVVDRQQAEWAILRHMQRDAFPEMYQMLNGMKYPKRKSQARDRKDVMKTSTNLFRLDLYMSADHLIRVGGRIRRADVPRDLAQPVLLPKKHHVSMLLLRHFHTRAAHAGMGITLTNLRAAGYWLMKGRSTVNSYLAKCVMCRRLRGGSTKQKMADLPPDRLTPAPPFTYVGVDFCGPFYVKQGRVMRKRYICAFICLVMKGVHFEVAQSLTTDSFLHAYRRFTNRRGPVRVLRCDRGTNFVGAQGELQLALKELDQKKIKAKLIEEDCDLIPFRFNVPHASHMGGVWERMLGTGQRVLQGLLIDHGERLDDELLHTLVVETEAILNSRPLTYVDLSSADAKEPLSPQQLLTLKNRVAMPFPGDFVKEDLYCRKRWRCVQYLANQFWYRWQREVLPELSERKKWHQARPNLKVDDIVLMIEKNLPRNRWLMGKITGVFPSEDDLVRKVVVTNAQGSYDRPVHNLVYLLTPDRDEASSEDE